VFCQNFAEAPSLARVWVGYFGFWGGLNPPRPPPHAHVCHCTSPSQTATHRCPDWVHTIRAARNTGNNSGRSAKRPLGRRVRRSNRRQSRIVYLISRRQKQPKQLVRKPSQRQSRSIRLQGWSRDRSWNTSQQHTRRRRDGKTVAGSAPGGRLGPVQRGWGTWVPPSTPFGLVIHQLRR